MRKYYGLRNEVGQNVIITIGDRGQVFDIDVNYKNQYGDIPPLSQKETEDVMSLESYLSVKEPKIWEKTHPPLFKKGDVVKPLLTLNDELCAIVLAINGTILINGKRHWLYALSSKENYKKILKRDKKAETLLDSHLIFAGIPVYYESEHLLKFNE